MLRASSTGEKHLWPHKGTRVTGSAVNPEKIMSVRVVKAGVNQAEKKDMDRKGRGGRKE